MIAALYIDPRGPYVGRPNVDAWDRTRDARRYAGPWPVVAHPPCGTYSVLRHLHRGGGGEAECGPIAVEQVRRWGGVLEQPAHSRLWARCALPVPRGLPDAHGYAEVVSQLAWGHVANKRTWLYLVGVDRELVCSTIRTGGVATHWVAGRRHDTRFASNNVPEGIKVCSARQARRTPPAFAEWLIMLAESARVLP